MRVATGRVVEGKVVVDGEVLPDGALAVVVIEDDGTDGAFFHLAPGEKAELLERIREARTGPWIDAWDLLRDVGSRT